MPNQGHWVGEKADPYHYFGFIYKITDETSGRMYIGKKQYWCTKYQVKGCKGKVSDKQSPKWKQRCWKESDWRSYKGSSKSLDKWIKDNPYNIYTFEIIKQCRSKGDLHYCELKELWDRDVLKARGSDDNYLYFNRSIGAIKFRPPEFRSEESKLKQSAATTGIPRNKEVLHILNIETNEYECGTRLYLAKKINMPYQSLVSLANHESKSISGWRLCSRLDEPLFEKRGVYSDEHKANISAGLLASGYEVSLETREKQSKSRIGERNHKARLTECEVKEIIQLQREGKIRGCEIAKLYGVSNLTISKIKTNRTWKHLER